MEILHTFRDLNYRGQGRTTLRFHIVRSLCSATPVRSMHYRDVCVWSELTTRQEIAARFPTKSPTHTKNKAKRLTW
jgi:hypothetical protein